MSRTPAVPSAACPCGRLQGSGAKAKPLAYADCCGRFIDHWDAQPAPDAECLMRSRYTAFVRERADFAAETIRKDFPDLAPLMTVRKTVLNWHSRQVEMLSQPG